MPVVADSVSPEVTPEKLRGQIERGEDALHALDSAFCRVRHHDTMACGAGARGSVRARWSPMHGAIMRELQAAGYESVTIDPKDIGPAA